MTVKELRSILFECNDDDLVIVGCEGYTNDGDSDYGIKVIERKDEKQVLICDNCYYGENYDRF